MAEDPAQAILEDLGTVVGPAGLVAEAVARLAAEGREVQAAAEARAAPRLLLRKPWRAG